MGPLQPGTYDVNFAVGAGFIKNGGLGGCTSPGTGGGCGSYMGFGNFTLTTTTIQATYTVWPGAGMTGSHLFYSCTKPQGGEAPGQYPIVQNFAGTPPRSVYMAPLGPFPNCPGGYYLMFHMSVVCGVPL